MSTEIDFNFRREPTELILIILFYKECSFSQIIFHSNGLQLFIAEPVFKRTNACGIAGENFAREGIDLVKWNFHCALPIHLE